MPPACHQKCLLRAKHDWQDKVARRRGCGLRRRLCALQQQLQLAVLPIQSLHEPRHTDPKHHDPCEGCQGQDHPGIDLGGVPMTYSIGLLMDVIVDRALAVGSQVHEQPQQGLRCRRYQCRAGFRIGEPIDQQSAAALQPPSGPEQAPGSAIELQSNPAAGPGVVADQLHRPGHGPGSAGGNRWLRL